MRCRARARYRRGMLRLRRVERRLDGAVQPEGGLGVRLRMRKREKREADRLRVEEYGVLVSTVVRGGAVLMLRTVRRVILVAVLPLAPESVGSRLSTSFVVYRPVPQLTHHRLHKGGGGDDQHENGGQATKHLSDRMRVARDTNIPGTPRPENRSANRDRAHPALGTGMNPATQMPVGRGSCARFFLAG